MAIVNRPNFSKYYLSGILIFSLAATIFLCISTYYINYWPTDSHHPYIPAATRLFNQPYVSEIHELVGFKLIMRFKESLILGIAVMQRLLNDFTTLFPNVLVLIIAVNISTVLFYFIFKKLFNAATGFVAALLFATSAWPYLYILQGAHPPLVLMNCLVAIFFLQYGRLRKFFSFLSGLFLGFMIFSSPTSPIYLPYYMAFAIYHFIIPFKKFNLKTTLLHLVFVLLGSILILLYFTLPDPVTYIKTFIDFLAFSQKGNDFILWKKALVEYFPIPEGFRGGGWAWIIKYFFFITPIMFITYLVSLVYLAKKSVKRPWIFAIILLSISTPVCVEIVKVAQFGRNYFSWIIGIILGIAIAVYTLKEEWPAWSPRKQKIIAFSLASIFAGHLLFNGFIFFNDILPSRMANTHIYDWLMKNDIHRIYTYKNHARNKNVIMFLRNPKETGDLKFGGIQTIAQVTEGYILVPPITGKTIWNSCMEKDFNDDPVLTALYQSGEFKKYVVARFPTLSSSPVWTQEQEVCTYRDLMLGQISKEDRQKGFVWILDGKKIHEQWLPKYLTFLKMHQTSINEKNFPAQ